MRGAADGRLMRAQWRGADAIAGACVAARGDRRNQPQPIRAPGACLRAPRQVQPTEGQLPLTALLRRWDSADGLIRQRPGTGQGFMRRVLAHQANAAGWHQKWHELPQNLSKIVPLQFQASLSASLAQLAICCRPARRSNESRGRRFGSTNCGDQLRTNGAPGAYRPNALNGPRKRAVISNRRPCGWVLDSTRHDPCPTPAQKPSQVQALVMPCPRQ